MKDELIKFETAKLAKEKGFDFKCRNYYLLKENGINTHEGFDDDYWGDNRIVNWNANVVGIKPFIGFVSASTQSLLQRWLRELHEIDLDSTTTFSKQYSFMCYQGQNPKPLFITNDFETYELALESALLEALNLIQTKP